MGNHLPNLPINPCMHHPKNVWNYTIKLPSQHPSLHPSVDSNHSFGWFSDEISVVHAKTSRRIVLGTFWNGATINATTMYQNKPVSLMIMEEVCCKEYVNITYDGNTKREVYFGKKGI
jgi:hypothetical protein